MYRILSYIQSTHSPLGRAYKVTDELFDLSTMAMEYFKVPVVQYFLYIEGKIYPYFVQYLYPFQVSSVLILNVPNQVFLIFDESPSVIKSHKTGYFIHTVPGMFQLYGTESKSRNAEDIRPDNLAFFIFGLRPEYEFD